MAKKSLMLILIVISFISLNNSINSNFCIPAMIVNVIVDPHLFLPRLISSIDHCITHLWINKPLHFNISKTIQIIKNNPFINGYTIHEHSFLLFSVTEGWNSALRKMKKAPWYLICAYDVEFFKGQLNTFSRRYWVRSGLLPAHPTLVNLVSLSSPSLSHYSSLCLFLKVTNMAFVNWLNLDPGGYNLFALSKDVINNIGYFDENFFPVCFLFIYC